MTARLIVQLAGVTSRLAAVQEVDSLALTRPQQAAMITADV